MRVGHGFCVQRLSEGFDVLLGGVTIPFNQRLISCSGDDALVASVCNALLGAMGLGGVEQHFPMTDERCRGTSARERQSHIAGLMQAKGFCVHNVDATIVAETPKMAPYIEIMCQNLAAELKITGSQINIKATSTEKLGYIGRKEGISVHSVVLLDTVSG